MTADQYEQLAATTAVCIAAHFEGLFLRPYLCPAGVPTIGYGATYYEDGRRVTLKDEPITRERAWELLLWMVRTIYLPAVMKLCPNVRDPGKLGALTDFAFNMGIGAFRASTLRRRVLADDWTAARAEFMKWIIGGGKKLKGLILRRQAEVGATA